MTGVAVTLIIPSERHFLLVESTGLLHLYSYEGWLLCSPKWSGMRPDMLTSTIVFLSFSPMHCQYLLEFYRLEYYLPTIIDFRVSPYID